MQKPKYRYGGSGIWSTIGRKIVGDSAKKIIHTVTKEKIGQTVGDALLSGASNSLKKATEKTLDKVINKEEREDQQNSSKGNQKFTITQDLINKLPQLTTTTTGRGIVYD